MGEFANLVRHGKIAGPSRPGFRRTDWVERMGSTTLDAADQRILHAGIALDDFLSSIRKRIRLDDIDLQPDAVIRLIVGFITYNLSLIQENFGILVEEVAVSRQLKSTAILKNAIETAGGQKFTADEVLTGCGDGIKHMLRQLVNARPEDRSRGEKHVTVGDVVAIVAEINNATLYHSAVEIWNDCLGNEYGVEFQDGNLEVCPSRPDLEIARVVSTYRRENMALRDFMNFGELWNFKWNRSEKKEKCEIPLVVKIYGIQRIDRIDLGVNDKALNAAVLGVASMLWLRHGYYQSFLDEKLPKLANLSINQIVAGWRILQSLAAAILNSVKIEAADNPNEILRCSPRISNRLLCGTLAKALAVDQVHAQKLVDVFVFTGDNSQDLWLQPLLRLGEDYVLVIPCIHSAKLERIVEGWMRQGGLDLDRRGLQFEKYCRNELNFHARRSAISAEIQIVSHEVKFIDCDGNPEKIDIVVIVGGAVLLVEAKCILWPDDALRLSNYRETIEGAAAQIKRQREAVLSSYPEFVRRLRELGYEAPSDGSVSCCIITNSAVYAGFPIDGVPVVDLPMLARYFENKYIKIERRNNGRRVSENAIRFYGDANQAGQNLQSYLAAPPQLDDMKEYVKARAVFFPIDSEPSGRLIYRTYSVDVDIDAMARKYESMTES